MGVPKFFRYISERYPCLSQLVLECEIPEFDNLYLDMNGIIHNCSHPGDYDPHFRISEEKIFKDIFHYIEVLFRIIKPQKLFFMAVDGVAPRAKMNQQRGRRFRSAKETEERDKEVLRKGGKLPEGHKFDSNCITPGTSFMARLQAQLKFFVASKISTDKLWQKVTVILSGHECPGEGEHKIMDYIRYLRAQSDYDPNTRHCLYGLDADLIMLGLCTHEPHFALLREEVKFGRKQSKKILAPEETKFFLLHLSLMREYLEMEFSELKEKLPFPFNLENIIDDWVLMGFLVGNDFIPHLPGLHISSGALPVLYKVYCEVLPTLDGYLNEGGTLNLSRFDAYMKKLASFDIKQFREMYDDLKYLKQKSGQKNSEITEDSVGFRRNLEPYFENDDEVDECILNGEDEMKSEHEHLDQAVLDMMDLDDSEGSDYYDEEDKEKDRRAFFEEFCLHKQNYYQAKLDYKKLTQEVLKGQAECYIKALQWNLNYYYNGLCSWSWYYPHHYAPYISDIQNFKDMKIEFELGKPFLPFEQLLAVLPAFSKELLPKPFQELMTDENSPIFDYYPINFQTDLNGKKNEWEAVVLIPFIDERRLLEAMESCYDRLTDEEKERNKHGPMHVFIYTEDNLGPLEAPAFFNSIDKNHAFDIPLYREDVLVPQEKLRKSLLPGALTDVFFPGFPTFKHLKYTSALEPREVKVFQSCSQGLNMIVKIIKPDNEPEYGELLHEYINKIVYVSWPYLTEAKIVGMKSARKESIIESGVCKTTDRNEGDKIFSSEVNVAKNEFMKSRGIDVGVTNYLLVVRQYEGQKFVFDTGNDNRIILEKKWSNKLHSYPLQTIVKDVILNQKIPVNISVDDIFPIGTNCFLLNRQYYGCLSVVNDKSDKGLVAIKVTVPPEPEPQDIEIKGSSLFYYTNNEAAQRALIPNHLLARITGTILVLDTDNPLEADKCPKVNIGLNLKFSRRNQQLPGYTRRTENNQWLYSDKTIALIREYADAFPEVIRYLANNSDKDHIFKNDLFPLPGQSHMLNVISNWLDSKVELKTERRSCDADLLELDVISKLEMKIEQFMKKNKKGRYVNLKVKPVFLYLPSSQVEKQAPDYAEFQLFDRVVNVRDNFVVPLGYRGTIIGIEKQQQNDTSILYCDILFDQSFPAAVQYQTKRKRVYKLPDKCLLNITFAREKFAAEESRKLLRERQRMMMSGPPGIAAVPRTVATKKNMPPVMDNCQSYSPHPKDFKYRLPFAFTVNSRNKDAYDRMMASVPNNLFPTDIQTLSSASANFENISLKTPSALEHEKKVFATQLTQAEINDSVQKMSGPSSSITDSIGGLSSSDNKSVSAGFSVDEQKPRSSSANFDRACIGTLPKSEHGKQTAAPQLANVKTKDLEQKETTLALKKLLKITDEKTESSSLSAEKDSQSRNRLPCDRNEGKGYVTELQELFQKAGKGNPKYEYQYVDGNFRATLSLPGIDISITSDPAPTKKAAGEKAAFSVLQFLNLVQNYGDRVPPIQLNDNSLLDLNLQFLRLQHKLSELQRQQQPAPENRPPQQFSYPVQPQELDNFQSVLRTSQQQNFHMFLGMQSTPQTTIPPTSMSQHMMRPSMQFPPSSQQMMPYQAQMSQPRQMALATNYIFQQNVPSKYSMPPQQLYYQNVQNIYYNHPTIRPGYPSANLPGPHWMQPMMPPQISMTPSIQPSRPQFFPEQMSQSGPPQGPDKRNANFYSSINQSSFAPPASTVNEVPKSNSEPPSTSSSQIKQATCSGRASKTPKKNRLAANFATKAAT